LILHSIPTHGEHPRSVSWIASRAAENASGQSQQEVELATSVLLLVLRTFDVIADDDGLYHCKGEMPTYFIRSLAWYLANDRQFVNNWERRGVGDDIAISELLDAAPYLLKIMEDKRLRLAGRNLEPARVRRVVSVLLKTVVDGRSHFLFGWDQGAAQYQLIGTRMGADEARDAAAHGLIEGMVDDRGSQLERGRHFDVIRLEWDRPLPMEWIAVSRTVGALTRYEMWFYGARVTVGQLTLGEAYQWLTIDEMLAGRTRSGRRTGDPSLYKAMNAGLAGGLEGVPVSIRHQAISSFGGHGDTIGDGRVRVFIGHGRSAAWRDLADHLRDHHGYHVMTYESEPRAGQATSDVLRKLVDEASFAILVHSAEDEQAGGALRARQNVIHETGLFQGRLGFTRAIVLRQRGCEAFSNLAGLHELHYTTDIREAFGEVVAALRREFG